MVKFWLIFVAGGIIFHWCLALCLAGFVFSDHHNSLAIQIFQSRLVFFAYHTHFCCVSFLSSTHFGCAFIYTEELDLKAPYLRRIPHISKVNISNSVLQKLRGKIATAYQWNVKSMDVCTMYRCFCWILPSKIWHWLNKKSCNFAIQLDRSTL